MDELGAEPDHAGSLLLGAGHVAGGVDQHDERDPERVALGDEPSALLRGVGVDDPAEVARLVGDDRDRAAFEPGEPGHEVARPTGRGLEQFAAVDDRADDIAHVVDRAGVLRDHGCRVVSERGSRRQHRRLRSAVARQIPEQLARQIRGVDVRRRDEVAHAVALVDARSAELIRGHVLPERVAHDARPGQEHARLLGHHDPVGQRRRVRSAARGQPGDDRDLGNTARQLHDPVKDAAVAAERGHALLHARAARGHEADDRRLRLVRQLEHAHDRVCVLLAERPAGEARVLGVAEHRPAVDLTGTRDYAVAGACLLAHCRRDDLGADHLERARIAQRLEALERAERSLGAGCERNAHGLPPRQSTTL